METLDPKTPILIGVGQFMEAHDAPGYEARSPVDVAAAAARAAIADTQARGALAATIDVVATTRTFHDSAPILASPFGTPNNFPRSIGKRLGIAPRRAIWEDAGGNTPQDLVSEMSELLAAGEARAVLLAGAEAISTARHLAAEGRHVDWAEQVEGDVEDRLGDVSKLISEAEIRHRIFTVPPMYALAEHARRKKRGVSRAEYARGMGALFAPFTTVAAANPYAASKHVHSPAELIEVTERNRMIADPYTRRLVARDQVNQGAALVMTTISVARELGIPEQRWVFLRGHAKAADRPLLEREDLGVASAAKLASEAALRAAGIGAGDVAFFDLYSCFPIAVSSVCDALGLREDDPRGFTVTGGLPYFGGPGNNYSMHAIASMVERVRDRPGTFGFVGANGGILSKYSVGVYASTPAPFSVCDVAAVQAELAARPTVQLTPQPYGRATIETYTIIHGKDGRPAIGVAVGRLPDHTRLLATAKDAATLASLTGATDPLGAAVDVTAGGQGPNRFVFAA